MAEVVKKPNSSFKPDESVSALSLSNLQLNLTKVLSQSDKNLDGQVDLQEFKGPQRLTAKESQAMADRFKFFDVDGDGAITPHDDVYTNGIIDALDRTKLKSLAGKNIPYGDDSPNRNNVNINKALAREENATLKKIRKITEGKTLEYINYIPKEETFNANVPTTATSKVYSYSVPINSLNPRLEGFRILHLSDLHFHMKQDPHRMVELQALVSKLPAKPDVVVITGDFIRDSTEGFDSATTKQLTSILPKVPILAVLGNHDYYYKDSRGVVRRNNPNGPSSGIVQRHLEEAGVIVLRNESTSLVFNGAPVNFTGVEDFSMKKQVNPSTATSPANELSIYLTHNLDTLERAVPKNYDLVLSGHTHSGEMNLLVYSGYDHIRKDGDFINLNDQRSGFKLLTRRTTSYISPGFARRLGVRIGPGVENSGITLLTLKNFKED